MPSGNDSTMLGADRLWGVATTPASRPMADFLATAPTGEVMERATVGAMDPAMAAVVAIRDSDTVFQVASRDPALRHPVMASAPQGLILAGSILTLPMAITMVRGAVSPIASFSVRSPRRDLKWNITARYHHWNLTLNLTDRPFSTHAFHCVNRLALLIDAVIEDQPAVATFLPIDFHLIEKKEPGP